MDLVRFRYGVRPVSRFNFLSVCPCVCPFVRLSRVRGFRWLYYFVSVYVCNIPPVCIGIVRLHIRTRIYTRQHIMHSYFVVSEAISNTSWSFIIPFERITVRIHVLRGGEARVHGLLLFHLKGLQYEFVFYDIYNI